jgi:arylformamidase
VDYLSVESFYALEGNPVHNTLLKAGIVILEGCNLSDVSPGNYNLCALPVKIDGANGSPCRAVLTGPEQEPAK